jgi:hypothetical protein
MTHPPLPSQMSALRQRVLAAFPVDEGSPTGISDDGVLVLSQAVHCHVRSLLNALLLSRQASPDSAAPRAQASAALRTAGKQGAGGGWHTHRLSVSDVHNALALSRRVSTAASWQLPLCRTTPPARWSTANLELLRLSTGPHVEMMHHCAQQRRGGPADAEPRDSIWEEEGSEDEWEL